MKKVRGRSLAVWISVVAALLAGCADVRNIQPGATQAAIQGSVHGGQQPVSGAMVQLYAAGTAGDGSAGTPLIAAAVVTDASGNFSTTSYTCPTTSTPVYLVASGGNPGLGSGQTNPQLVLIAALGACGNITNSTVAIINELTTVAAVYALAPFTSSTGIGSGTSDAAAMAAAFTLASEYVNVATGLSPGMGVATGYTVPVAQINTIADIQATCVNSAGGVSGDATSCGTLFSLTTPSGGAAPTDTLTAILNLANNPALNTTLLYNLSTPAAPFQPTDIGVPPDFSVSLSASATMSLSPTSLSYPNTYPSQSSTLTTTLTNTGPGQITLSSIGITGQNSSDYNQTNNCPTTMVASASCTITVNFAPTTSGSRYGYLTVLSSATNSPVSIQLFGTGLSPTMSVSPSSLTFPLTTVGTAATGLPVVVSNSGIGPVSFSGITVSGSNSGDISQTNNCPATLAMGASCTVMVTVTPSITGAETGTLYVNSSNASTPSLPVSLAWSGAAVATTGPLVVSAPSLFVGSGQTGYLDVTNQSANPVGITSITLTGATTQTNNCGTSLAAGASCLISITLASPYPLDTGTLTVNNTSTNPALAVTIYSSYYTVTNFGDVAIGASSSASINAPFNSNYHGYQLNGSLSGADVADYSGSGFCFSRSSPCAVTFTLTPSAIGSRVTAYSAGYVLVGYGVAPGTAAQASASPTTLAFPQTALNASSAGQTITITNPGGHLVNLISTTSEFQVSPSTCTAVTCTASVTFTPTSALQYGSAGSIVVFDSVTNQKQTIYTSGYGGIPTLAFTPSPLNFGSVTVGQSSASRTVSVSDTGDSPAYLIFSFPTGGTGSGDFYAYNFSATVTAGTPYTTYPYQFIPTNVGVRSGTVTVTDSRTGLLVGSYSVTGTGVGALTTTLSAAPGSIGFPNTVIGVASAPLTVTVTNSGNFAATLSSVGFGGANATDFATPSSCATVPAQATCTFSVTFTPGATGLRSGTLLIASNDPASPLTVPLSGTGSPIPTVTLSPTSLMFYERGAPQTVTLSNLSANPLTISAFNMVGHYTQTNNCGTVLAGNSSCAIQVSADSTVGVFTGSMTVVDSDTVDTQVVTLNSNVPYGTVSDFGSIAVGVPGGSRYFTGGVVTVFPTQISLIYSFSLSGPNPGDFNGTGTVSGCGNHSGFPCQVTFVFQPTGVGVRYAIATANDGSIYLFKGTGLSTAQTFTVSPSSLSFNPTLVGSSASTSISVTNTSAYGVTPYVGLSLSTGPSNNGDFSITNNTCYSASYGCYPTIVFTPTTAGPRSTVLTLTSGTGYQRQVTITGTGRAALAAYPPALAFASTVVGTPSSNQLVTVSNGGTSAVTLTSIGFSGTNPGDFSQSTTCGSSLAAGSTCSVYVTFTPTATGARSANLAIASSDPSSPLLIPLSGTGSVASGTVSLAATASSLTFGTLAVRTTSGGQSVTIGNNGTAPASLGTVSLSGANPGDFSTTPCPATIPLGTTCLITVTFTPTAKGPRSANVVIPSNDPNSPLVIALGGTGQ